MAKKELKNLKTGVFGRSLSLAKLGLSAGAKAAGHAVGNLFGEEAAKELRKKTHLMEQALLISQELGELKGSLMKAGQMLSVYGEHFLPPEVNQILKTLQGNSPPVEWKEIEKILVRQLGKERLAELKIDPEAIGAASLGQVHRAEWKSKSIVLKVQYPGVDRAIDGDIKALRKILSLTEWLPKIPATDELFVEVKFMLKQELDYDRERSMLEFFTKKLANDPRFILPKTYPEFSTKKVIAMSFEEGVAVDSEEVKGLSQIRRNKIGEAILDLYFRELFLWRKVQTDPHFGNYRIRLSPKGDQIVLFDYGAVREVSEEFMTPYTEMLSGLFHSSRERFETAAAKLGILHKDDPAELKDLFYQLCSAIVEPFNAREPFPWRENDLPKRVSKITWEIFRKFPLRAPPREVVFLDRKMAGIFTFLAVLDVKIDSRKVLAPYLNA
jgi:predicted unusual protein kinase regulating ubiquinone biosynthesis (AarF/ABC1/UbiB family)